MNKRQTLIDYASSLTKLKDIGGGKLLGCCPVHQEKTGSFYIYANGDNATCFGCGFQGDVFDLYQTINGGNFKDAKKAFGFGNMPIGKPFKKKKDYLEYTVKNKKGIYLSCRDAIIGGSNIKVLVSGVKINAQEFIWLCLKDNEDRMKYIYQLTQEIEKPLDGDLFYLYCADQDYLFNYGSWGVEL
jgi:hypothetical protein